MTVPPQFRIDEILAVLTEAARDSGMVRVTLVEPHTPDRPPRIVEGRVLAVADGRDGRTRVRIAIPTGSGEPVEVRLLVESIADAEALVASLPTRTTQMQARVEVPAPYRNQTSMLPPPDETGPRRRSRA